MTSFDQNINYFTKGISNTGLYCRISHEETYPTSNPRLKELLFTERPQNKYLSETREKWPNRRIEKKSPKLVDNDDDDDDKNNNTNNNGYCNSIGPISESSIVNSLPSSVVSCPLLRTDNVQVSDRRRRRKPAEPQRSASRFDPNFRGVLFLMQTKIINGNSELVIKPLLKNYKIKKRLKRCRRRHHSYHSDSPSGSDLDNSPKGNSRQTRIESYETQFKSCESCNTRKTPLWRDAEDGTPLCNACGIRYKKYRIRCGKCWHIPKKDDKTYPKCVRCNAMLRLALGRKI